MPEPLRPCPYCGDTRGFFELGGIECPACGARGPSEVKERVCRAAWNTRPGEDALRAEVERLRAALGQYADEENWGESTMVGVFDRWMIDVTGSRVARAALASPPEETP